MTPKLCASEPVPAVVGTATIGTAGRQVRAVVLELPDGTVVRRTEVDRLGGVHRRSAADRDDDRARQAEVAQARPRRARRSRPPGSARPRRTRRSRARRVEGVEDRVDDPGRRTPGSVTTKTREPPAAATTSGSRCDRPDPEPDPVAQDHLERAIRERPRQRRPRRRCRRACRGGRSASAGSPPSGTSARSSRRPGSRRPRPRRSRARPGR